MSNCSSCGTTTTIDPTCPYGDIDAQCVIYTGEDLDNLGVDGGSYLHDILIILDSLIFTETDFEANSSDTITATAGGTNGHSPIYEVHIDSDEDNAITESAQGLMVDINAVGDGKVKVDSSDDKDFLEDQLGPSTDVHGIVTITPTNLAGKIYFKPSINIENLLLYIRDYYYEEFCLLANSCIPDELTTTSTSTTTTSSTTTSSSTTTTTTSEEADFIINNISRAATPFTITFRDQVSSINYVVDSATADDQTSAFQYNGTGNDSEVVITHSPTVPVTVQVIVNGVQVYNTDSYIGSVTISNIDPQANVTVNLIKWDGTTTSTSTTTTTTSTTTTSSSTTTTTTYNTSLCVYYTIIGGAGGVTIEWEDCETGAPDSEVVAEDAEFSFCSRSIPTAASGTFDITVTDVCP